MVLDSQWGSRIPSGNSCFTALSEKKGKKPRGVLIWTPASMQHAYFSPEPILIKYTCLSTTVFATHLALLLFSQEYFYIVQCIFSLKGKEKMIYF